MMRFIVSVFVFAAVISQTRQEDKARRPLAVVPSVDLARYCGTWYEIARLPNTYQAKCAGEVTATYTLLEDGSMKVVNRCRTATGDTTEAEGMARRKSDDEPNSKLQVRFAPAFLSFLPFVWGNYWIIGLAEDYSYVVIGEPDRKYLWILARSPKMDETLFRKILSGVTEQDYDVSMLIRTKQGSQ